MPLVLLMCIDETKLNIINVSY